MRFFVLIVLCISLVGCLKSPPNVYPQDGVQLPTIIQWSTWEDKGPERWMKEAKKRWPHPIIFICHGGNTVIDGVKKWYACPDKPRERIEMYQVAKTLHNLYPDNDIILVSCNETGVDLYVPRVWYVKHLVWQTPDGYPGLFGHEQIVNFGDVGTAWEFVTMGVSPSTQPTTRLTEPSLK